MKILLILAGIFLASTAYIAAVDIPNLFYVGNVLFHFFGGLILTALLGPWLWRRSKIATYLLVAGLIPALYLGFSGNTLDKRVFLWIHIVLSVSALLFLGKKIRLAAAGLTVVALAFHALPEPESNRIKNTIFVPTSMEEEGNRKGPFWPSAANTNVGTTIPSDFFMESEKCGACHKDIYDQWKSSMHHMASFNNQFYRKAIEYMQDTQGSTQPSKWCAGCHDHAVFFNGRWEQPIKDQINTPEAHNGLGCMSCHSISHVNGSVGNGGFTIEYPPLHELASSENPLIQKIDHFFTNLDPGPHRKTFMKPFMREQSAEYCSTCHKVHLDSPVNDYRWIRGFNDYDNWQASGVSGQGARSFYYPEKTSTCSDCHMPLVPSKDPGNVKGMVHSHRFPGANTAVPFVENNQTQLKLTEGFLKSGFISIDIFAASPVEDMKGVLPMQRRATATPELSSTMAVGEEGEMEVPTYIREVGRVAAPLDTANVKLEPGSTNRIDVVVRTKKIGHFFPGGTIDAFDIWTELQARDADGKIIYWSGMVEDGGKGQVDPGAHFYKSYMVDGEGNPINKRNAWQARAVLYVRLIPPGAADTVHYRVKIPKDVKGPVTFTAKLNYRKFTHYYTQFAYSDLPNVSGPIKDRVPDLPIITLAEKTTTLQVGKTDWTPVVKKADRERWNDWGIGMLLQGDLKGAEYAFNRVTEAEPKYADGWLNIARALIQEGETEAAQHYIDKAMDLDSSLARIHFFQGMIHKAAGDYEAALVSFRRVEKQYPRDRVNLNQIGRILFLQRNYKSAIEALNRVLLVDTEDVQAHYNLMLAYRGAGDQENAALAEKRFRRFKADESSQAVTARPRMLSPEDNNERQAIHDHESVPSYQFVDGIPRDAEKRVSSTGTVSGHHKTGRN